MRGTPGVEKKQPRGKTDTIKITVFAAVSTKSIYGSGLY
jgi:hypothetical protein